MSSLRSESELRKGQKYLTRIMTKYPHLFICAGMGTGKTAATLTAIRNLLDSGEVKRVLIIAPHYVAEYTWPEEIAKWEHTAHLTYSIVMGTPAKREAALKKKANIYLINRENVPWLWGMLGNDKWKFDMIVYDESSRLKSGKIRTSGGEKFQRENEERVKRGLAKKPRPLSEFGCLSLARTLVDRVVLLTGTPSTGGLEDLWGQSYIVDLGERLGRSKTQFLRRWFVSDYMGWNWTPKPEAFTEIMESLQDVMVSMRTRDYVDLPPVVHNTVKVHLPSKVLKEYRVFEKSLVSETYDLEACSRGVLQNKLLQYASGTVYRLNEDTVPPSREEVKIHTAKLEGLESIVNQIGDEPLLVAYGFKSDVTAIKSKFKNAVCVEDDPKWKKKWDKGQIKMLLAHPASIGHGLNLQDGGHHACWYSQTWNLEHYLQFNERLPRAGQKAETVFIHHIVAEGTVDETVLEVLSKKDANQKAVTEAVRLRVRGKK